MDFSFSEEELAFREEVRQFISDNITPEIQAEIDSGEHQRRWGPESRALLHKLVEKGWWAISWPTEWGGQGGSRIRQYVVEEELARVDLPVSRGGGGVPAIIQHGTPKQQQELVRPAVTDDVFFALGFTEPAAGADLAGLKCRAARDGDHYVINGQKMFTSAAHVCTHIYLMARTDPDAERHSGLSIFLVPIDTPGITVHPVMTVQNDPPAPADVTYGTGRTNEVFFDDVRVPVSARLGEENAGWSIGQGGLNLDRVGASRYLLAVHLTEALVELVRSDSDLGAKLRAKPLVHEVLGELWTDGDLCRLMTMRSMSIVERGQKFTYEGAADKVFAPEYAVRSTEKISQLLGPYAQLLSDSPDAVDRGLFAHNLLGVYQAGINHGSVQVMRDQVAKRGLSLPRR